jgi:hypothetical protein
VTWEEFRDKYEREVLAGLAKNTEIKVSRVLDSVETDNTPAEFRHRLRRILRRPAAAGKLRFARPREE